MFNDLWGVRGHWSAALLSRRKKGEERQEGGKERRERNERKVRRELKSQRKPVRSLGILDVGRYRNVNEQDLCAALPGALNLEALKIR